MKAHTRGGGVLQRMSAERLTFLSVAVAYLRLKIKKLLVRVPAEITLLCK